ncbi:hypothetical protein PIB30_030738 [Stylosanthes scabra]|uniref:Uncharacterized protein n=1 Tax=Stylosanthes scabra TaxID=79078 RepID=A0ABU6WA54_9FABA|nr:hypothetical protein [Stylosanthes scabra]
MVCIIVVRTRPNRPVGPVQPRTEPPTGSSKARYRKCIRTVRTGLNRPVQYKTGDSAAAPFIRSHPDSHRCHLNLTSGDAAISSSLLSCQLCRVLRHRAVALLSQYSHLAGAACFLCLCRRRDSTVAELSCVHPPGLCFLSLPRGPTKAVIELLPLLPPVHPICFRIYIRLASTELPPCFLYFPYSAVAKL